MTLAITGATGYVGGGVARRLAGRGASLVLPVRDPSRAPELPGAEVCAVGGYGDRDGMERALAGANSLLLVPAEEAPDRVEQHRAAVDAAVAAGVRRVVYLSVVNAAADATFLLARDHWATEEHVRAAGVAWTFLRMSLYLDFLPRMAGEDDVIAGPADEGRVGWVARDDLADVAAAVLLEPRDGETLDVTGGAALTLAESAEALARVTGRPYSFQDETLEQARASRAGSGAPDWMIEAWISTYTAVARGELATVSDTVARLTGREPRGFDDVF